jgi:hypothetical protein
MFVLNEFSIFAFNQPLLCLFATKEGNLLRELGEAGMCMSK